MTSAAKIKIKENIFKEGGFLLFLLSPFPSLINHLYIHTCFSGAKLFGKRMNKHIFTNIIVIFNFRYMLSVA